MHLSLTGQGCLLVFQDAVCTLLSFTGPCFELLIALSASSKKYSARNSIQNKVCGCVPEANRSFLMKTAVPMSAYRSENNVKSNSYRSHLIVLGKGVIFKIVMVSSDSICKENTR